MTEYSWTQQLFTEIAALFLATHLHRQKNGLMHDHQSNNVLKGIETNIFNWLWPLKHIWSTFKSVWNRMHAVNFYIVFINRQNSSRIRLTVVRYVTIQYLPTEVVSSTQAGGMHGWAGGLESLFPLNTQGFVTVCNFLVSPNANVALTQTSRLATKNNSPPDPGWSTRIWCTVIVPSTAGNCASSAMALSMLVSTVNKKTA